MGMLEACVCHGWDSKASFRTWRISTDHVSNNTLAWSKINWGLDTFRFNFNLVFGTFVYLVAAVVSFTLFRLLRQQVLELSRVLNELIENPQAPLLFDDPNAQNGGLKLLSMKNGCNSEPFCFSIKTSVMRKQIVKRWRHSLVPIFELTTEIQEEFVPTPVVGSYNL